MSNPTKDAINDRLDDNWQELLQEYMESDEGIKQLTDWLWNSENDELRESLLDKFGQSKDGKRFREWAWRQVEESMQKSGEPEDMPGAER